MTEVLKNLGISTSSNIGVEDGCMPTTNTRRNGNHHPNLWSDDFIQSINSQYGDSIYHEHREMLINEVHKLFSNNEEEFGLLQRLWFIDVLQLLGIERYFQDQIKMVLDYTYKWDTTIIEDLPDYMKISFKFAFQIHKEITSEGEMKHGPFVHKYIQKYWESYILSYFQEAEWIASNYTPNFDQYILNGTISSGMQVLMMYSIVLMNTYLSDTIMEQFDLPSSKFQGLVSLTTRLIDDIKDFEDEKARGETASSIECYMKENQGCTREDALNYITNCIDSCVQELNKEFLKPSNMPTCFRRLYFNACMRGIFFFFKDIDGLTHSHQKEIHDAIMKVLVEPIVP